MRPSYLPSSLPSFLPSFLCSFICCIPRKFENPKIWRGWADGEGGRKEGRTDGRDGGREERTKAGRRNPDSEFPNLHHPSFIRFFLPAVLASARPPPLPPTITSLLISEFSNLRKSATMGGGMEDGRKEGRCEGTMEGRYWGRKTQNSDFLNIGIPPSRPSFHASVHPALVHPAFHPFLIYGLR